jgi:hypothetical protein
VAVEGEWMAKLLDGVAEVCGSSSTLTAYAAWWLERERVDYYVSQDSDALTLDVATPSPEIGIRIVRGDSEAVVPAVPTRVRLGGIQWRQRRRYIPTESEIAGSTRVSLFASLREWRRRRQRQTARE